MPFDKFKSKKNTLIGVLVLAAGTVFLTFGTPEGGCGGEFELEMDQNQNSASLSTSVDAKETITASEPGRRGVTEKDKNKNKVMTCGNDNVVPSAEEEEARANLLEQVRRDKTLLNKLRSFERKKNSLGRKPGNSPDSVGERKPRMRPKIRPLNYSTMPHEMGHVLNVKHVYGGSDLVNGYEGTGYDAIDPETGEPVCADKVDDLCDTQPQETNQIDYRYVDMISSAKELEKTGKPRCVYHGPQGSYDPSTQELIIGSASTATDNAGDYYGTRDLPGACFNNFVDYSVEVTEYSETTYCFYGGAFASNSVYDGAGFRTEADCLSALDTDGESFCDVCVENDFCNSGEGGLICHVGNPPNDFPRAFCRNAVGMSDVVEGGTTCDGYNWGTTGDAPALGTSAIYSSSLTFPCGECGPAPDWGCHNEPTLSQWTHSVTCSRLPGTYQPDEPGSGYSYAEGSALLNQSGIACPLDQFQHLPDYGNFMTAWGGVPCGNRGCEECDPGEGFTIGQQQIAAASLESWFPGESIPIKFFYNSLYS